MDRTSLRVALRTLGRHKGFTIVAVSSLALAIALNTTMYSVLDAMLNPRVAARDPDSMYALRYYGDFRNKLGPGSVESALRAGVTGFGDITGHTFSLRARLGSEPLAENGPLYRRVSPTYVWPNFFNVLGTQPLEGTTFGLDDNAGDAPAVISDRLARHLFPNQSAVGRPFTLDGEGYTVIGVVERSSLFAPLAGDVWLLRPTAASPIPVSLIRLNQRVEPPKVEQELSVVAARLALAAGEKPSETRFHGTGVVIEQMKVQGAHYALIGAVIAVLLVACANLANLQLARGLARTREIALRSAIGASRRHLIQHLVLETALLALAGLMLGLLATMWGAHVVRASLPPEVAGIVVEPQTSWRTFAFAALATLFCLFLAGLLPALRVSRVDPDSMLKSGAGTGVNREHRTRYGLMVVAQIGLALPVLIGAVVLLKATIQMNAAQYSSLNRFGYDTTPIVAGTMWFFADNESRERPTLANLSQEVVARARNVPGILDAATYLTAQPEQRRVSVDADDGTVREVPAPQWSYEIVSPSYFRTFGRGIAAGRDFREGEADGMSIIISQQTAHFLWPNRSPIGRAIKLGHLASKEPWRRVVGVLGDPRDTFAIRRADYTAGFRLHEVARVITPHDSLGTRKGYMGRLQFYARARGSTELAAVRLQRELRGVNAPTPPGVVPLDQQYGRHIHRARQTFMTWLFGTFAGLAVGLLVIGVYGIVAHSVAERRREIAVRISLGATERNILRAILREGNVMLLAGVAIGLFLTRDSVWWLGRFMADETAGYDALLMAVVAAVLFGIAVFAALVPAWRATRIDPVEALRHE